MATSGGVQTHDFLTRLKKHEKDLPDLLIEMARVMGRMIEEIDRPQIEDVQRLHEEFRRLVGDRARLAAICGTEGRLCSQCPFGAYLPSGFPYASEKQPLCLPWIAVAPPPQGGD